MKPEEAVTSTHDGKDRTDRPGGRRASRRSCGSLTAALAAFLMLCCFLGAVAPAGAASDQDSAQALLTRLALQQNELTAAAGAPNAWFGYSVALCEETALVGAPHHDTPGQTAAGAAYVFTRSGGSWTQQAMLTAADGAAGDHFSHSVALFGETALIGAPRHEVAGQADAGAAYVFTRSGGSWTQQAMLTAADGAAGDELRPRARPGWRNGAGRRAASRHRSAGGRRRRRLRLHRLRRLVGAAGRADRRRRRRR